MSLLSTNVHLCYHSDELWRANERKKKLESLCKRKDLIEREHLMMELQDTNEKLRERQHRIQVGHHG